MKERSLIYHPSGRAGAYANGGYAANIFKGCTHGCKYCYVPAFCKVDRVAFHASVTPAPNMLKRLEADMKRIGVVDEPIFLCFTCDPFCAAAPTQLTLDAIKIIMASGNSVNILTKGWYVRQDAIDLLAENPLNKFGVTLTFSTEALSSQWEPKAAIPKNRLLILRDAHHAGISTWASIEPVIIPEQSLAIMEEASPYVDEFNIGKWNHDKRANDIDWPKFVADAIALMEKLGKKYVLKGDLLKYKAVEAAKC